MHGAFDQHSESFSRSWRSSQHTAAQYHAGMRASRKLFRRLELRVNGNIKPTAFVKCYCSLSDAGHALGPSTARADEILWIRSHAIANNFACPLSRNSTETHYNCRMDHLLLSFTHISSHVQCSKKVSLALKWWAQSLYISVSFVRVAACSDFYAIGQTTVNARLKT